VSELGNEPGGLTTGLSLIGSFLLGTSAIETLIDMLQKLSEPIAYCCQRASECRAKAANAANEAASQEYYELERRWLMLARSYELS
jgi:hypothetical protein